MQHIELDFNAISELASQSERKGNYSYAIELWKKSATLAHKEINQHWCVSRAAFLTRWQNRLKEQQ